jgi:hypothetical protein
VSDAPGRSAMSAFAPDRAAPPRGPCCAHRTEVAQMPKDKDTHSGPAQNREGGLLRNLILLALPLLSFQRDILHTIKTSLETHKEEHIRAIANLLAFELHALMMILDPARKLRGRVDDGLERELKHELTEILKKLTHGVIDVVDIQEKIIPHLIDILKEIKNGKHTNTRQA